MAATKTWKSGTPEAAFDAWHRANASPVGADNGHLRRKSRQTGMAGSGNPRGRPRNPNHGFSAAPKRSSRRREVLRRELMGVA